MPFTVEQFLNVFRAYNLAIWPAQVFAYVLGIAGVLLLIWKTSFTDKTVSSILAGFWIWMGGVYHLAFFSEINRAAYLFGALFLVQGILFLFFGLLKPRLSFHFKPDVYGLTGGVLILYAMIIYPLLGAFLGHSYPFSPMFGVAPCPATIFTFGVLLWTDNRVPRGLLIIPGLWAIVGSSAAVLLGIGEDIGLLLAGGAGMGLLLLRDHSYRTAWAVH